MSELERFQMVKGKALSRGRNQGINAKVNRLDLLWLLELAELELLRRASCLEHRGKVAAGNGLTTLEQMGRSR